MILLVRHCCLRSVDVSIKRWFPLLRTSIEERKRLFLMLSDWQMLQSQHKEGMPVDVPEPKNKIFILKLRPVNCVEVYGLLKKPFYKTVNSL